VSEPANDLLKNQPTVVSVPRKKDKPKVVKPPAIQALIDNSPQILCELGGLFVKAKDLNSRAKIRAMMKAILDFNSVDTSYPSVGNGDTKKRYADPLYGDAEESTPAIGGVRPIAGSENII
jgi:hypothetical protein